MQSLRKNVSGEFSKLSDSLVSKLKNKIYRDAYMDDQVRVWVARQIRVLREERGWSQEELAERCGKKQSVISRLEDPEYGRVTLNSLLSLRAAFDTGFEVRFVEYGKAVRSARNLSKQAMSVESFNEQEVRSTGGRGLAWSNPVVNLHLSKDAPSVETRTNVTKASLSFAAIHPLPRVSS